MGWLITVVIKWIGDLMQAGRENSGVDPGACLII